MTAKLTRLLEIADAAPKVMVFDAKGLSFEQARFIAAFDQPTVRKLIDTLIAAKEYIDATPCDPDVRADQWECWKRYEKAMGELT